MVYISFTLLKSVNSFLNWNHVVDEELKKKLRIEFGGKCDLDERW